MSKPILIKRNTISPLDDTYQYEFCQGKTKSTIWAHREEIDTYQIRLFHNSVQPYIWMTYRPCTFIDETKGETSK